MKPQTAGKPENLQMREVVGFPIKVMPGRQNQLFDLNSEVVKYLFIIKVIVSETSV